MPWTPKGKAVKTMSTLTINDIEVFQPQHAQATSPGTSVRRKWGGVAHKMGYLDNLNTSQRTAVTAPVLPSQLGISSDSCGNVHTKRHTDDA